MLPIEEKTKPACRPRGRSQSVAGVSEHEESCNDRASEAADNIEQTFEDKPMVIPENVVEQRSSALLVPIPFFLGFMDGKTGKDLIEY